MKSTNKTLLIKDKQKKLGRPIDDVRTKAILQAVGELVIEQSIAGLTMEGIAKRAKVSKVTLYRRFGGLESLIRQYVQCHTSLVFSEVPDLSPVDFSNNLVALEVHLAEIGYQLMKLISRRDVLLFDNAIAAAIIPFPDIGLALYQAGPKRAITEISQILQPYFQDKSCTLSVAQSAESLFSLWQSGFYNQLRMTGIMRFDDRQLRQHIERQTHFFFNSWQGRITID